MFEKGRLDSVEYMQDTGLPVKRTVLTLVFIHLPLVYPTFTRLDFSIFQAFQHYYLTKYVLGNNNNIILGRLFSYQSNMSMLFSSKGGGILTI